MITLPKGKSWFDALWESALDDMWYTVVEYTLRARGEIGPVIYKKAK